MSTDEITDVDQLEALLGRPAPRVLAKDRAVLHELDRQWLAASPLCLVATADASGRCDVSPKGDPVGPHGGVAHVLDDRTIVLPERAGNRRADGFRNLLQNPQVGLIFLVPGRGDTLRVNGRARIVADAPYFDELVVRGHRPLLALVVTVEEVFHHCSKAFLRSSLWDPTTWEPHAVPRRAVLAKALERQDDTLDDLDAYYGPSYAEGLYPSA